MEGTRECGMIDSPPLGSGADQAGGIAKTNSQHAACITFYT